MAICLVFTLSACGGGGGGSDDPAGGGNGNGNGGGNGGGNSAPAGPWLCFTALTAGSSISTTNQGGTVTNTPSLEFSTDGENWESFDLNTGDDATNTKVTLANAGDKVYLRATDINNSFSENTKFIKFKMEGSIAASGNIMSLLDKDCNSTVIPNNNCFTCLFSGCSALVTAPKLPATNLTYKCYNNMFNSCTGLTTAPDLPAMTLANNCYEYMFAHCTNLTTAPDLPATTLATSCYEYMFYDCSSLTTVPVSLPATTLAMGCYCSMFAGCSFLTTAPDLPAITLAYNCYASMFNGCSSLTTAPALPAITLADSCYYSMFNGCYNLNSITVYFTTWNDATYNWVNGVSATGNFYCPGGLDDSDFDSTHIPPGWTVHKP